MFFCIVKLSLTVCTVGGLIVIQQGQPENIRINVEMIANSPTVKIYGGFVFARPHGQEMKGSLIFLSASLIMCAAQVYAYEDGLLNLNVSAPTCPYGQYHLNGKCVEYADATAQGECDKDFYLTVIEQASFMAPLPYEPKCLGTYAKYAYTTETNDTIEPLFLGSLMYTGASLCPYGSYHLDGKCVEYGTADAQKYCGETNGTPDYLTVIEQASFMALFPYEPKCLGTYTQYDYTSNAFDDIYPLFVGTILSQGSPIGDQGTFKKMYDTKCEFNGDEYYSIELVGVADDYQPFMHPVLGMCNKSGGYGKFAVPTDCKDINNDEQISENWYCGVLCDQADAVYTNSGVCSAKGYCLNGGKGRRLHVGLPNDGGSYSYPLYASKTTTPSLNFQFVDDNGGTQTCYVNLVPPEAIEHFVGKKPNPLRLGYELDYVGPDSEAHNTPTLITID